MTDTIEFIRVIIRTTEPGAVTEPQYLGEKTPDRIPVTDHLGRCMLPATSVAGSMRALVASKDRELADRAFGFAKEKECYAKPQSLGSGGPGSWASGRQAREFRIRLKTPETDEDEGVTMQSSKLRVVGTALLDGPVVPMEERSTAIDRDRAAASASTLRQTQTLPMGTRFEVSIRWDDPEKDELSKKDPAESDLSAVLRYLAGWRPLLGSGVSAGRGAAKVDLIGRGRLDLRRADDLATFLTCSGPMLFEKVAPALEPVTAGASAVERVEFKCQLVDALRIGSGTARPQSRHTSAEGRATTNAVAEIVRVGGSPVIPARSLRGVIRSRAEYILRSLGVPACKDQKCGKETCPTCMIFGHGGGQSRAGAVRRRSRVRFLDAKLVDANGADARVSDRTHVAIDRFTGGAAKRKVKGKVEGLLFSQKVVDAGEFVIAVEPLDATDDEWADAQALITLVIDDMDCGYVGIGAGTTRGQGTVKLIDPRKLDRGSAVARLAGIVDRCKGIGERKGEGEGK